MNPRFAWLAALSAAAWPAAGAVANGSGEPAFHVAAAAAAEARSPSRSKKNKKVVKLECNTGPLRKTFGGQPWTFYSCSDAATLIVMAAEGNPAAPFLFFLGPRAGGNLFAPILAKTPDSAAAARDELIALPPDAMARLIVETRGQPAAAAAAPAPVPAGEYEEEQIGGWRLRTDRKARTFGVIWENTGVIELAAGSADGKAGIVVRDNGARLLASLRTPACFAAAHVSAYDGEARAGTTLARFAAEAPASCSGNGYEAEIRSWLRGFPAAARAMQARARALYGPDSMRCIEPPFDPEQPPHHPPCGFPPPEIGENHPK